MTTRDTLTTLWVFLYLNFIFCDVFSLMYPPMIQEMAAGMSIGGIVMSQGFLLGFAVVMEIGMAMVLAARFLPRSWARPLIAVAALGLLVVQIGSLFAGANTLHYLFFSAVEIATLIAIAGVALRWRAQ